jgi:hypothetical protein
LAEASETPDYPQRQKRQRLPPTMARVDATFRSPNGRTINGRLWDISSSGACLQFNHSVAIAENTIGELVLQHSYSKAELELQVEVCWVTNGASSSLMGTVFSKSLKPGTFLDPYL